MNVLKSKVKTIQIPNQFKQNHKDVVRIFSSREGGRGEGNWGPMRLNSSGTDYKIPGKYLNIFHQKRKKESFQTEKIRRRQKKFEKFLIKICPT